MHYKATESPTGTRRVRTDLNTSENVFIIHPMDKSNLQRTRTRTHTSSPIVIKHRQHQEEQQNLHSYQKQQSHHHHPQQCQHVHAHHYHHNHYQQNRESRKKPIFYDFPKRSDLDVLSSSAPQKNASFLSAHLPARATRLLNRSRLQQQCSFNSDSPDRANSSNSLRRGTPASSSRASSNGSATQNTKQQEKQHQHQHQQSPHMQRSQRDSLSSSDDLMLYDKSFRNAMIQDVLHFKKQLLRLRRVLEEANTINPFDTENGTQLNNCCFDLTKDADLIDLISSSIDEPIEDISDLRRQVVYLQSQIDDRDRTIRLQRDLIEKLEAEKSTLPLVQKAKEISRERNNMATQTERTRPLSIGAEGLTRSKPEYTSYTTHFPAFSHDLTLKTQQMLEDQSLQHLKYSTNSLNDWTISSKNEINNSPNKILNQTRRHTIISTTLTNYNTQQLSTQAQAQAQQITIPRRASVAWDKKTIDNIKTTTPTVNPNVYKPVRITLIGDTLKQWNDELLALKSSESLKILNDNREKLENYSITHKNRSDNIAKNVIEQVGGTTVKSNFNQINSINNRSNGNHRNSTVTIV